MSVTPTPTAAPTDTPEPTKAPTRTLKKNFTGEDVKQLQQALIDLGYLNDAADGTFGTNTEEAVIRFQAVNGLSADGLAGVKTQELLYSGNALSADQAPKPDFLMLVNRQHKLGKNDAPTDLVTIESVLSADIVKVKYSGTKADRTATEALGRMLSAAIADGLSNFQISSAYRTYSEQQKLVDNSVAKYQKNNPDWSRDRCLSATYNTVAPAGTSEHQTGLAFDITVPNVSFTGTAQQKWLHEHCAKYGFVVRFTADKQKLTGFVAESWHFRYVGTPHASLIARDGLTLEDYIAFPDEQLCHNGAPTTHEMTASENADTPMDNMGEGGMDMPMEDMPMEDMPMEDMPAEGMDMMPEESISGETGEMPGEDAAAAETASTEGGVG